LAANRRHMASHPAPDVPFLSHALSRRARLLPSGGCGNLGGVFRCR